MPKPRGFAEGGARARTCPAESLPGHPAELPGHLTSDEQVAHQRLVGDVELVGLHVVGAGAQPAGGDQPGDPLTLVAAHLEIVLDDGRLPVEQDGRQPRVGLDGVERLVEEPDHVLQDDSRRRRRPLVRERRPEPD